jgi:hypothetical protein
MHLARLIKGAPRKPPLEACYSGRWDWMNNSEPPAMSAKQVLVVEDEALAAIYLEGLLHDLGNVCVGPMSKLSQAIEVVAG